MNCKRPVQVHLQRLQPDNQWILENPRHRDRIDIGGFNEHSHQASRHSNWPR